MREERRSRYLEVMGEGKAGKGFFCILGYIWVTPGWEDDSVRINVDGWGGRA